MSFDDREKVDMKSGGILSGNRYTTISFHGNKDIPKGTLAAILRDLDLTKEDLDKV